MISRNIKPIRSEFVDCAKGIAAVFVIFGHFANNIFLKNFGYSFHMPLFFLISGFFINTNKNFGSFILNKLFKLILPVVFFILFKDLLYLQSIASFLNNFGRDLISCFYGSLFIPNSLQNIFVSLPWFTFCLFASDIVFYFVLKIFKNKKYIFLTSLLLSILGFVLSNFGIYKIGNIIRLPFSFDLALYNQLYLFIGWFLFKKIKKFNIHIRELLILIIILIFSVSTISINHIFSLPNHFIMDMNCRYISYISLLFSLFSCFVILMISKKIESTKYFIKIFSYLGRISLVMYLFQGFNFAIFSSLYSDSVLSCITRIAQSILISEFIRLIPLVNSSFGLKNRLDLEITRI